MSDSGNLTVDDLLAEIRPREATARVLLRQDLVEQHRQLEADLEAATQADNAENRIPIGPELAQRIVDLEAEMEASRREFRFRAIGRRAWADLMKAHPPGKDDKDSRGVRLDHNPATFPAAAIAASCVEVAGQPATLTVDQVYKFYERLDVSQWDLLYQGCLDANVGDPNAPKSMVAGFTLRMSALSGATAANGASHAASSSDEL